jgi:hypothetical protein
MLAGTSSANPLVRANCTTALVAEARSMTYSISTCPDASPTRPPTADVVFAPIGYSPNTSTETKMPMAAISTVKTKSQIAKPIRIRRAAPWAIADRIASGMAANRKGKTLICNKARYISPIGRRLSTIGRRDRPSAIATAMAASVTCGLLR